MPVPHLSCRSNIFSFVRIVHHENGHRQSSKLPAEKGGWGENLVYTVTQDADRDFVNDTWESAGGYGATLGFEVTDREYEPARALDEKRRAAWEHGWDSLQDAIDGLAAGYYTNREGYQPATGRGLTRRNEDHVADMDAEIRAKDWSLKTEE